MRYGLRAPGAGLAETYANTRAAGFGDEVKRRIMLGTYALRAGYYDAYYRRAQQVRRLIAADYERAFASCDVLASPTSPVVAFPLGARSADPLAMYLADVCTISCNLAGLPGLSVPCGFAHGGEAPDLAADLPVGLQLVGPALGEAAILHAAAQYERATDWHTRRPQAVRARRQSAFMTDFEPVIGLECHVQLRTRTKVFSGAAIHFGDAPNAHTDPYTLALPGTAARAQPHSARGRAHPGAGHRLPHPAHQPLRPQALLLTPTCRRATRSRSTTSRSPRVAASTCSWIEQGARSTPYASPASTWRRTPARASTSAARRTCRWST